MLAPVLLAQTPAPATVRGVLVRWGTDEPVGQATLELRSATGSAMPVAISVSQDNGEFVFTVLVSPYASPAINRIQIPFSEKVGSCCGA